MDKNTKEQVELNVYPNPANNSFKIQSNLNGLVTIKDITGRKIFDAIFTSPLKEINVQEIVPGIYTLTLERNNGIIASKQIIIFK